MQEVSQVFKTVPNQIHTDPYGPTLIPVWTPTAFPLRGGTRLSSCGFLILSGWNTRQGVFQVFQSSSY